MSPQPDPPADPFAHLDGAYVLGALSSEERARYEAHLAQCPACRAGVERLSSVLPYLAESDESVLDAAEPPLPDTLLPQLLVAAGRASRRRRSVTAALGALAVACLAAVVFLTTGGLASRSAPGRPMTALAASPVTAEVRLQATPWGTRIDLTCRYTTVRSTGGVGYSYALSVLGTDGRRHELGTWQLTPGAQVTFTTGTALTVDQISSVDITDPYGTRLLTLST